MNLSSQLPESSATWAREATLAPPSQWSLPSAARELSVAVNASAPASSAADERADRSTLERLFWVAVEKRLFDTIPLWLVLCVALVLLVGLVVAHVFFILRCCRDRRRKAAQRSRKSLENGNARRSKKPGVNYIAVDGMRVEGGMPPPPCDPFQRDIDMAYFRDGSPATCAPFSGAEPPFVMSASTLDGRVGQSRRKTRRSTKSLSGDVLSNPNLSALLDSPADFANLVRESVRSRSSRGAGAPVIFAEELEVADLRLAHTGSYKPLGAALYSTGLGSQQPISSLSPDPSREHVSLDVGADRVVSAISQLSSSSSQK